MQQQFPNRNPIRGRQVGAEFGVPGQSHAETGFAHAARAEEHQFQAPDLRNVLEQLVD